MNEIKYMRLILFFDLPSKEDYEKKDYRLFHNSLIKNGYVMIQFSVYIKAINSFSKVQREIDKIRKEIPQSGNIRMLAITEKQYLNMAIILGHKNINEIYNNTKRYLKI